MFGRELRTPLDIAFGAPPDTDLPKIPGFEYMRDIQQYLAEAHEFARQRQQQAGARQKRGYDLHCQGRSFVPGERVWDYHTHKKGLPCRNTIVLKKFMIKHLMPLLPLYQFASSAFYCLL
jgi:hypothetical protein